MNVLSHLGCDKVFDYFAKICEIPHGSFHEKALSDYIVSFAKERGLYCRQDNKMNVLIKKGGTAGYESSPVLIMQGHIDMVCDKNEDTTHDFLTEPLEIYIDGDDIKARGTWHCGGVYAGTSGCGGYCTSATGMYLYRRGRNRHGRCNRF